MQACKKTLALHLVKINNIYLYTDKNMCSAGWTPLHIAASAGRDEIVKALIAKAAGVLGRRIKVCEVHILLPHSFLFQHTQIAIMLLENGANPDATDHFESTPLHRAAAKGNLKMVQILVQHNATVDIRDSEGNTPLVCCYLRDQFQSVRVTATLKLVSKPQ
uniref:Proteasome 26S subunit, non-ATPase 10 n=1 Tax=Zosterops lateralis melanops TaxID=1220523 RepID=A0A8D2PAD7_ZOSLA